jgi:3-hydroxyisobutyrate dehydrogenase
MSMDGVVGFIGVGQMGRPMVDRLVAAGWPTEVSVRRAGLGDELRSHGVRVADSPVDLASRCDVLIVCLFNDDQVRQVVLDGGVLGAMRPGSVLVSHVTGSPELARELQDAAPDGVGVLDVPISGTADHIRDGRLTLLVGGEAKHLDHVRAPLESYGNPILEVGGLGDGQRIKLINNLLFTAQLRFALDAAALGESIGIAAPELSRVVAACSGDSFAMRLLQHRAPSDLEVSVRPYLSKDVAVVREVARAIGLDLGRLGDVAGWVDEH